MTCLLQESLSAVLFIICGLLTAAQTTPKWRLPLQRDCTRLAGALLACVTSRTMWSLTHECEECVGTGLLRVNSALSNCIVLCKSRLNEVQLSSHFPSLYISYIVRSDQCHIILQYFLIYQYARVTYWHWKSIKWECCSVTESLPCSMKMWLQKVNK